MASSDSYQELSREEAVQIKDGAIQHASHVMLYSKVDEKLFDSHDIKYAVLVSYIYVTSYVCSVWSHSQITFSIFAWRWWKNSSPNKQKEVVWE